MTNSQKFKTAEERAHAYDRFCEARFDKVACCAKCELQMTHLNARTGSVCPIAWLDLEAEMEKTMPCPFCGSEVKFDQMLGGDSVRCKCGYCATFCESESEAIAAHNRVARAVMKEKEGDQ